MNYLNFCDAIVLVASYYLNGNIDVEDDRRVFVMMVNYFARKAWGLDLGVKLSPMATIDFLRSHPLTPLK